MPAININDLNNAQLDVNTIAGVATSTAPTVIDRLGNVKSTVFGAVQTLKSFNVRGVWAAATAYALKDVYTYNGYAYVVVTAHTSTTVASDLTSGYVTVHQGATREDLAAPSGAGLVGFVQARAGAIARTLQEKTCERVSVLDFYANGISGPAVDPTGSIDSTLGFQAALNLSNSVYVPEGTYLISGSGFTMKSGQMLEGVKTTESGGRYPISGSILKFTTTTTRFIFLDKGVDAQVDTVTIKNFGFYGNNQDFGIYGTACRQSTFEGLRFANFKKCLNFNDAAFLNVFRNITAFDFDQFCFFNSGGEDSRFTQVFARSYRANSAGVFVNYYGQTMIFDACDLSECGSGYVANIGLGDHSVIFNSCYFEMSTVSANGAIFLSAGAGNRVHAILNGCRFFYKSATALPNSTAFIVNGPGTVEIECNGGHFSQMDRIVFDNTGATLSTIRGTGNIVSSVAPVSTVPYAAVSNYAKRLGFFGRDNLMNLTGINEPYIVNWNFTAGSFVLNLSSVVGNVGIFQIDITSSNEPQALGRFEYQPKSYFATGLLTKITDTGTVFTGTTAGDTITIASTIAALMQICIRKIA